MAEAHAPEMPGPGPQPEPAPLLQQLKELWQELPGLVSDRVELLSLELQRATQSLIEIVALLVGVAVLGVTVWLLLWAALIGLMVAAGLAPHWALLVGIAVNAVVIVLALQRVRGLLPMLRLSATRRHLMVATSSPHPSEEPSDDRTVAGPSVLY